MQKGIILSIVFACVLVVLIAGCTNAPSSTPSSNTQSTNVVTTTITNIEIPTTKIANVTLTAIPTSILTIIPVSPTILTPTISQRSSKFVEPFVNTISYKLFYPSPGVTNCEMGNLFPDIVNDPTYGINRSKPQKSKLQGFSAGELKSKLDLMNTNVSPVDMCSGAPANPYWNVLVVNAILTGRNQPGQITNVTVFVSSNGYKFPVMSSPVELKLDQVYPYTSYIILKADQVEYVSPQIGFN
jgi:hypothetical protein